MRNWSLATLNILKPVFLKQPWKLPANTYLFIHSKHYYSAFAVVRIVCKVNFLRRRYTITIKCINLNKVSHFIRNMIFLCMYTIFKSDVTWPIVHGVHDIASMLREHSSLLWYFGKVILCNILKYNWKVWYKKSLRYINPML